jgi:hypothetical protein
MICINVSFKSDVEGIYPGILAIVFLFTVRKLRQVFISFIFTHWSYVLYLDVDKSIA